MKVVLYISLIIFTCEISMAQNAKYMTYTQPVYSIKIPSAWNKIPQSYFDAFEKQAKGTSAEGYSHYDCGFQKHPMAGGYVVPPIILVKLGNDRKFAQRLSRHLNKSSSDKISMTYRQASKAASRLLNDIGIMDTSASNIIFDKKRQMIRFETVTKNAQNTFKALTSIYIYKNKTSHVICTTGINMYAKDKGTFVMVSDSFKFKKEVK